MNEQKEMPRRKKIRLDHYDYSSCGTYFITICTAERRKYFWNHVGATIGRPQDIELSHYGKIVNDAICGISSAYPAISVENYVIMPNHIHMLLQIRSDEHGRPLCIVW